MTPAHVTHAMYRALGWAALCAGLGAAPLVRAADGDLDPSFGTGGQLLTDLGNSTDIANAVAVQPDGKLVVVGTTYTNNDYSGEDFAIVRYLSNGALDPAFGTGGKVKTDFPGLAAVASSVVLQPDGKIVVAGGAFPLFTFLGNFQVARYLPGGALDPSFGNGGIVTTHFPGGQGSYAYALALQSDGKIVAAGTHYVNFSSDASSDTDFALARYMPDGTLDASFGTNGLVTTDFSGLNDDAFSILVQPDGKLVAVGSATTRRTFVDFALARYLPNGSLDASFGSGGKVRTDFGRGGLDQARAAALQPDGRIVVAGTTIAPAGAPQLFALARYNANGSADRTFHRNGRQTVDFGSCCQGAYQVLLQPNGRIVAVGYANTEASDSDFLLARVTAAGALDTTFGTGGKVRTSFGTLNGGANGATLQPDGRIVAVGFQALTTGFPDIAIARYLNDATSARVAPAPDVDDTSGEPMEAAEAP